jgi:hypothetical protein
VSAGYYPTKVMIGNDGQLFHPGPFLRAYLLYDLPGTNAYLFTDAQFIASSTFSPKLGTADSGVALRPFTEFPGLEFRLGADVTADFQNGIVKAFAYIGARFNY